MKGDGYRSLTADERERFVDTCRRGTDPKAVCPLCLGKRLTKERRYGFCKTHWSWEHGSLVVDCHVCRVRYAVLDAEVSACLRATA
ncbi:MAG: hypothetical protein QOD63_59 [Actinomycetota bacterium]|nr:hypothetical protein [Actinomycetota bacterium]